MKDKKPTIKYVKKAKSWCKTTFTWNGKEVVQKQEWYDEKPTV